MSEIFVLKYALFNEAYLVSKAPKIPSFKTQIFLLLTIASNSFAQGGRTGIGYDPYEYNSGDGGGAGGSLLGFILGLVVLIAIGMIFSVIEKRKLKEARLRQVDEDQIREGREALDKAKEEKRFESFKRERKKIRMQYESTQLEENKKIYQDARKIMLRAAQERSHPRTPPAGRNDD